ncbi:MULTISPECIES: hypothetical protein [unclassified Enterococcus]|uniref:hypothetical protein n=1 Tax=unclassified Enterococcus TaxID=2608891 RepID=UPI0013EB317F|nr:MULTISPECIES: hypothetical protein [unclassified Enterococcus]
MDKNSLAHWLEDLGFEMNSLSEDAFTRKDINRFRSRKNKILIHFITVTAAIEKELEGEENNVRNRKSR